jgi:hypothetical protein
MSEEGPKVVTESTQSAKQTTNAWLSVLGVVAIFVAGATALKLRSAWSAGSVWLLTGWLAVCAWIAGTLVYVNGPKSDEDKIRATVVMDASVAMAIGLIGVTFWQHDNAQSWAVALLWAVACLALGGVSGLLFGVPRSRTSANKRNNRQLNKLLIG